MDNTQAQKCEFRLSDAQGLIDEVIGKGGEFRFYPKGTSMLPLIREGKDSIALVKAPLKLKKNDIPLYVRANGSYVLHRVIGQDDSGYITCGDNQTEPEHSITHEQIKGVVKAIYRGERRIESDSLRYRMYCLVWSRMWFRRAVLFVRKRLGGIKNIIARKS